MSRRGKVQDAVAVIGAQTNAVTGNIVVGSGPRQMVFSPDGTRAYVTTETGIYVITTVGRQGRPGDPGSRRAPGSSRSAPAAGPSTSPTPVPATSG